MVAIEKIIVLIEDQKFYTHKGINLASIVRALIANIEAGKYSQGGSTLTQQLARTLYLNNKKIIIRKLVEIIIAFCLEIKYNKHQILEKYMLNIYMGQNKKGLPIKGLFEASQHYFNKSLANLDLIEKVALVALIKGPNIYKKESSLGIARRSMILSRMLQTGLINQNTFFEAIKVEL